ncbi:DUF7017 domain-containing protein [Clostridioides difficile]|uniref:DUF7017 domain-containing protein n=1 Tax=Clostridioides difficile TaxID=1496 RepID=UPI000BB168B8|nr:hypothetical protein [Clostridioides difficile]EGT2202797.1 hypothetical protein [Clostridioides difficile]EGT2205240.1 hypothetical protein [Clostridioides difficile]EGT3953670.1 hypothetical protein [Clostridioides difficile]EGT4665946.1 hypothetical protein [Clostridioides difficile]MCP3280371.1 hypothetical protein [Clostridioides difficile]
MDKTREMARLMKKNGEFDKAVELYTDIWKINKDKWVGWEYAFCLRNCKKIEESIQVLEETLTIDSNFQYSKNYLASILYEKHFKNIKEKYTYNEELYLEKEAKKILNLLDKDGEYIYKNTVFKILKILKNGNKCSAKKILYWLDKVDLSTISDEPLKAEVNNKIKEYQSEKEMYYSYKTKALYESKQYDECVEVCIEAINNIKHFHHNNDLWIKTRKAKAQGICGDKKSAVNDLVELSAVKSHWLLFLDIAELYYFDKNIENSLIYCIRAALTKDPVNMKVELYYKIAWLLEHLGEKEMALNHLLFARQIREQNKWKIPNKLDNAIARLKNNKETDEIKINVLYKFWVRKIRSNLGEKNGEVCRLLPNGKAGFIIEQESKKTYYFQISSVLKNTRLYKGNSVKFSLVNSFDPKKKMQSLVADYIEII